jgi:8-oxo-dGTP pyrophosphatase MutT (NUDIX family)
VAVAIKPAATVVVLRDGARSPEVFMVRRHEGTAFMAGAHVFPGGRVDAADRETADAGWCDGIADAAARLADLPPADAVAYYVAAARELFEEAGVLLARNASGEFVSLAGESTRDRLIQDRRDVHGGRVPLAAIVSGARLRLALDALVPFAHWVTPPADVRRFDTRFFVARVPPHQTPQHDDTETIESVWIAPAHAIQRAQRDEISLPPPTWTTLRELEPFTSVDAVMAWARTRAIVRRQPTVLEGDGRKTFVLAETDVPPGAETRFVLERGRWRRIAAE